VEDELEVVFAGAVERVFDEPEASALVEGDGAAVRDRAGGKSLVAAVLGDGEVVRRVRLPMNDARTRLAEQVAAEVRNHFGDTVLSATIPRSVRISEAPGYGQSVMTYDPGSRGAVAYADAGYEFAIKSANGNAAGKTTK